MKYRDKLLNKDARSLMDVLSKTKPCIDVIITSPPYWNLKDYQAPDQVGHGQSKQEYLRDMENILDQCFQATKPSGSLWLVVGTYREGNELKLLPFELAEHARQVGWILRDLIIWDKQKSVPWQTGGHLRNLSEYILFMTKSDSYKYYIDRIKTIDELSKWWVDFPERFNPKGKTPTNIWSLPMRPKGGWRKHTELDHYCSFPTALVARILEVATDPGDIVMDPFAGSGVVLAQAAAMGRHYIGLELNGSYIKMFEETVKDEVVSEWENLKEWRKVQENALVDFEQTVMKLRALKYTRQVTKPFLEAINGEQQSQIHAIFCIASIPKEYQRDHPFHVEVLIVVENESPGFEIAFENTKLRAAKPPLTQYGIHSEIEITTVSDLKRRKELVNSRLYLYLGYKPRKYVISTTFEEWLRDNGPVPSEQGQKVPLLSNIAVDVAWVLDD